MIIMIVFMILTVLVIIGTAVYLNIKKKNNDIQAINDYENNGKRKNKKLLSNILNIKIKDNIICTGNRYSMVIELGSVDYNILSTEEQATIENVLIQTVLAIDYPIQFFSTTEYIDTTQIISYMKTSNINNSKVAEYRNYLIEYLDKLMENRSIAIPKNYAIISCDGIYENIVEELNRKVGLFIGNLRGAKIVCSVLTENELYNLLYRELNKNSATKISNLMKGGLYVGKKKKTERN